MGRIKKNIILIQHNDQLTDVVQGIISVKERVKRVKRHVFMYIATR